jgi:hypothetical protein
MMKAGCSPEGRGVSSMRACVLRPLPLIMAAGGQADVQAGGNWGALGGIGGHALKMMKFRLMGTDNGKAAAEARTRGAVQLAGTWQQPTTRPRPCPHPPPPLPASPTLAVLLQHIQVWALQRVRVPDGAVLTGPQLPPELQQHRRWQQQTATAHNISSRDSGSKQPTGAA